MLSLPFEHSPSRSKHQANVSYTLNTCRLSVASLSPFPFPFIAMSVGALQMGCSDVHIAFINQLISLSTLLMNSLARSWLFNTLDYLPSKSHGLLFPSRLQIGIASMTYMQSLQMPTTFSNTSHMSFNRLFGMRCAPKWGKRSEQPTTNTKWQQYASGGLPLRFWYLISSGEGAAHLQARCRREGKGFWWGIYATGDGIDSSSAYHSG